MPRTGRGRWYEAVGGLGLELERESGDPEYRWINVGYIHKEGKRRPVFRFKVNHQEESYDMAQHWNSIEEAKAGVLETYRVTEIVTEEKPAPFAWMKGRQ